MNVAPLRLPLLLLFSFLFFGSLQANPAIPARQTYKFMGLREITMNRDEVTSFPYRFPDIHYVDVNLVMKPDESDELDVCFEEPAYYVLTIKAEFKYPDKLQFDASSEWKISYDFINEWMFLMNYSTPMTLSSCKVTTSNEDPCDITASVPLDSNSFRPNEIGDIYGIPELDHLIVITRNKTLLWIDTSNRSSPKYTKSTPLPTNTTPDSRMYYLEVYHKWVIIAFGREGLEVFDVSDVNAGPKLAIRFDNVFVNQNEIDFVDFAIYKDVLAIVDALNNAIYLVDVSTPSNPRLLSTIQSTDIPYAVVMANDTLITLSKSRFSNTYFLIEYVRIKDSKANYAENRKLKTQSTPLDFGITEKFAFVRFENMIGIYEHSILEQFTPHGSRYFATFLHEGIIGFDTIDDPTSPFKETAVAFIDDQVKFLDTIVLPPSITCDTFGSELGDYKFNVTMIGRNCDANDTYTGCYYSGQIALEITTPLIASTEMGLMIGLGVGGFIILIAGIVFCCKYRKLKYQKLENDDGKFDRQRGGVANEDGRVQRGCS